MNVLNFVCRSGASPVIRRICKAPLHYRNVAGFVDNVASRSKQYSSSTAGNDCIKGTWFNELGSTMTIDDVSNDGSITGHYQTAVGRTTGIQFPMIGKVSSSEKGKNPTFGFVVNWKQSTTSWVGQYYPAEGSRKEVLMTTWILRDFVSGDIKDDWESTLTSRDLFARKPVTISYN
ncbi:avidin-like [Amphiura filiformis]|uniref:avidin-like n=1 Tax=Amphiura filiformis TaxID=82378 RepID=UPI003B20CC73